MFRRVATTAAATGVRLSSTAAAVSVEDIVSKISARGVFKEERIKSAAAEYLALGFDKTYANAFDANVIAEHVYGYICAQAESAAGSHFSHSAITKAADGAAPNAFFFCTADKQIETTKDIEAFVLAQKDFTKTHAVSVRSYHSQDSATVLFTVQFSPFKNAEPAAAIADAKGPTLEAVSTDDFLSLRSGVAKERYQELLTRMHTSFTPVFSIQPAPDAADQQIVSVAFKADRPTYFGLLTSVMNEISGAVVHKKFLETFSNGVQIYTMYVSGAKPEVLAHKANVCGLLPYRPEAATERLFTSGKISAQKSLFFDAMLNFAFYFSPAAESEDFTRLSTLVEKDAIGLTRLKSLRANLTQQIKSEAYLGELIEANVDIAIAIYNDFKKGTTAEERAAIQTLINERFDRDVHGRTVFTSFLQFNQAAVKHNFFKPEKAALCFRLDPSVFMPKLDFGRQPHGIFMFAAPGWRGFHVRFADVSRGGVRMVISDPRAYRTNRLSIFQENYNLAHTQHLKNKDIPEGGSKGTILVSKRRLGTLDASDKLSFYRQYVDSINDVIVPGNEGVVDNLKEPELIFLGPDENTAGKFPVIAAFHAKDRGFPFWKAFTTGKETSLGGIPHDTYGMTTRSVRRNVLGIYRKLEIDGTKIVKFQTGGPDGDLGSNEILRGIEITQAIVDGSGVLYDPNGLNREELVRLATKRAMAIEFDTSKLSAGGFFVKADKNRDAAGNDPVVLPDGTKITKTVEFRDTFHFSPYLNCDIFVPCGGRPRSVTLENVHLFLKNHPAATGEAMLKGLITDVKPADLKFKYIVEGANLFITDDARIALEKVGVTLIKDAAANKGGVTSSSLEVFTTLCLTSEQHDKLMCCEEGKLTDFYKAMVEDICSFIEGRADREFELIWKTQQDHPGRPKTLIIDALSRKIVDIRSFILRSNLFDDKKIMRYILDQYTPKTIKTVATLDEIMERVPESYQKAICSVWLASNYVYSYGIDSNEFDFYEFMQGHRSKAVAMTH